MNALRLTRRQALWILAAAGAVLWPPRPGAAGIRARERFLAAAGDGRARDVEDVSAAGAGGPVYRWRGSALGARASIVLYGADADRGRRLRPGWEAELRRLDGIFSLYRGDSALCRLNRDGGIDAPPLELVELLSLCRGLHRLTGGVFDPTVQPLWELYARRFAGRPDTAAGSARPDRPPACDASPAPIVPEPGRADRERVLRSVGLHRVDVTPARIEFRRPGMGITLNGIAQGYLTDRMAAWLLRSGVTNALVDVGEIRAFGRPPGRDRWRIGRAERQDAATYPAVIEIAEGAVATSSPAGYRFGGDPRHHHLFDSRTGASALAPRTVTVAAPAAALADGLSTAFAMMAPSRVRAIASALPGVTVYAAPAGAGRAPPIRLAGVPRSGRRGPRLRGARTTSRR